MGKKSYVTERYKNEKRMEKGNNKLAKRGYIVDKVVTEEKSKGCLSWGLLGIFNFFRSTPTEFVVTYRLEES